MIVEIGAAEADLSCLIDRACAGEEVVLARDGVALVRMVPVSRPGRRRVFGSMKDRLTVPREFFEPLPDDEVLGYEP
jgi:antitoxin (DNA-binding transcriptional repressor) of toxin-antitoxin stability system